MLTAKTGSRRANNLRSIWIALIGSIMLLLPVVANGYPLLFFDTPAYLTAGEGILKRAGIVEKAPPAVAKQTNDQDAGAPGSKKETTGFSDARSIYYGLLADLGRKIGGLYLTAAIQALWIASAVVFAMKRTGPTSAKAQLGVMAAVALLGGAAFTVSVILPDMAGGVLLLGLAIVAGYADRLSRGEWIFWLISIIAAISFHKAFFLVGIATFIASGLLPDRPLWRGKAGLLMSGALAASAVLTFGTEPVVERITGVETPHVPFLLGRMVEDGTAVTLMREECPRTHWATCAMLPGMPMNASEFLWDGTTRGGVRVDGWVARPVAERSQISAEASEIVKRTALSYPWWQTRAAIWNAFDQFVSAGVTRYHQSAFMAEVTGAQLPTETLQMKRGTFYERPAFLAYASAVMVPFCVGSALLLSVAVFRRWSGEWDRSTTFGAAILLGTVLNAAIGGALVVVVDRYQGRLAWTLMFAALVLLAQLVSSRRRDRADLLPPAPPSVAQTI
jgi:hypothetical protein